MRFNVAATVRVPVISRVEDCAPRFNVQMAPADFVTPPSGQRALVDEELHTTLLPAAHSAIDDDGL